MIDPLKLHSLADGELDAAEMAELREKVAKCEESCAELQAIQDAKALAARIPAVTCEETWKRCVSRLNEIDRAKKVENWVGRYAWGLCGAFFIAILAGGYITKISHTGTMRAGDVPRMVSSLVPSAIFKGTPKSARSWVSSNMPEAPKSLLDDQLQVVGGRVGVSNGHRVMQLQLHDVRGDVMLVMVCGVQQLENQEAASGFDQGMDGDVRYVAWTQKGCAMLVYGMRDQDELQKIATGIAAHQ